MLDPSWIPVGSQNLGYDKSYARLHRRVVGKSRTSSDSHCPRGVTAARVPGRAAAPRSEELEGLRAETLRAEQSPVVDTHGDVASSVVRTPLHCAGRRRDRGNL